MEKTRIRKEYKTLVTITGMAQSIGLNITSLQVKNYYGNISAENVVTMAEYCVNKLNDFFEKNFKQVSIRFKIENHG